MRMPMRRALGFGLVALFAYSLTGLSQVGLRTVADPLTTHRYSAAGRLVQPRQARQQG